MQRSYFIVPFLILASLLSACAGGFTAQASQVRPTNVPEKAGQTTIPKVNSNDLLEDCPVTVTATPSFEPPASSLLNSPLLGEFWFGSDNLWTSLPVDGIWAKLPKDRDGYTQKIFWWSSQFSLMDELEPDLVVTGERLDEKAPPLISSQATNAFATDIGSAMLVGVDFPTTGCWKITGQYKKAELSFVIWIAP